MKMNKRDWQSHLNKIFFLQHFICFIHCWKILEKASYLKILQTTVFRNSLQSMRKLLLKYFLIHCLTNCCIVCPRVSKNFNITAISVWYWLISCVYSSFLNRYYRTNSSIPYPSLFLIGLPLPKTKNLI